MKYTLNSLELFIVLIVLGTILASETALFRVFNFTAC